MSAALDNGTVTPGTIFLDTGTIIVGGVRHPRLGQRRLGLPGYDRLPGKLAECLPGLGLHQNGQ